MTGGKVWRGTSTLMRLVRCTANLKTNSFIMVELGIYENALINRQIMREDFWDKMRRYIKINNLEISEYDLRIDFDGQSNVQLSIDGTDRDCIYWIEDELFEVRQPKNKEVHYWETSIFSVAIDIMLKYETPEKYKRLR